MKSLFWLSSYPLLFLPWISHWWSLGGSNRLFHCWQGCKKRPDGFLPWLFFQSSWPSFQWNPHAPWPLLQEVRHLYFFLLRVMVAVVRSFVSDTTGFLVTHYGISFMDFLGALPLELFPVDPQSSGYGPFYHTCDKLYLTWKMTLF